MKKFIFLFFILFVAISNLYSASEWLCNDIRHLGDTPTERKMKRARLWDKIRIIRGKNVACWKEHKYDGLGRSLCSKPVLVCVNKYKTKDIHTAKDIDAATELIINKEYPLGHHKRIEYNEIQIEKPPGADKMRLVLDYTQRRDMRHRYQCNGSKIIIKANYVKLSCNKRKMKWIGYSEYNDCEGVFHVGIKKRGGDIKSNQEDIDKRDELFNNAKMCFKGIKEGRYSSIILSDTGSDASIKCGCIKKDGSMRTFNLKYLKESKHSCGSVL